MSDVDLNWVKLFDLLPDACLILDRDLVMVHANQAYTTLTGRTLADLVGHHVEEVFPVNPADPTAAQRLSEAYRRVLRTGVAHRMGVVRYDLPNDVGGFDVRYWSITLSPVEDTAGEVGFVCHRGSDVTDVHATVLRALSRYAEQLEDDVLLGQAEEEMVQARDTAQVASRLLAEVEQMHEALASRAGIEQAKGIIMGDRRCNAEDAFTVLRELSQHANRKLREVADALVATTTDPNTDPDPATGTRTATVGTSA